jgi:hypothetical protein
MLCSTSTLFSIPLFAVLVCLGFLAEALQVDEIGRVIASKLNCPLYALTPLPPLPHGEGVKISGVALKSLSLRERDLE